MFALGQKVKVHGKGDTICTITRVGIEDSKMVFAVSTGEPGKPGNTTYGGLGENDIADAHDKGAAKAHGTAHDKGAAKEK